MTNPTGFLEHRRVEAGHRPVSERIKDWYEVDVPLVTKTLHEQAARCMDCGIPFCHAAGCPVKNRIPEFNDLVYRGRWQEAAENLHSTNNFPEITGRVCPAPCEAACTLNVNDDPVTIKQIEFQIAEKAFSEGWVQPIRPAARSGKRVAVIGSGPAGLAAAQELARAGHEVVVFEKDDRVGGLLRYGIPDFKLEKHVLDRRLEQLVAEGVKFEPGVHVGADISGRYLRRMFDGICLTMGAGKPRPLGIPGADLKGVHFAMEFLTQQNRRLAHDPAALLGAKIWPRADTWWSSAAATRAATAWAPRSGKGPPRSPRSRSFPCRRRCAAIPRPLGPPGPRSCGPPAPRKRAARAAGASSPRPCCPAPTAASAGFAAAKSTGCKATRAGKCASGPAPASRSRPSWC